MPLDVFYVDVLLSYSLLGLDPLLLVKALECEELLLKTVEAVLVGVVVGESAERLDSRLGDLV